MEGNPCQKPEMRFHLLRSKAFWFGLPGLVFLIWGWWVSMGHISRAVFSGGGAWGIAQLAGDVVVIWDSEGGLPDPRQFGALHQEGSAVDQREWKMWLATVPEWRPTFRYVLIPYYWVVLAYVAVWAGLLVGRARKYRALPA